MKWTHREHQKRAYYISLAYPEWSSNKCWEYARRELEWMYEHDMLEEEVGE